MSETGVSGSMGQIGISGPVVLNGTGYSLASLKRYISARLPEGALHCIYHSQVQWLDDGSMVSLPATLDESTPLSQCSVATVGDREAVTHFAFYENNDLGEYYAVHAGINSYFMFDDDPFLVR